MSNNSRIKTAIKRIASVTLVIVLMAGIMYYASGVFQRSHSGTFKYAEFWEDPSEYDVWFMGSSHSYHGFQPMDFWNRQGIRSYDIAFPTCHIAQAYWTMMCALEEGEPELIVLDTYELHLDKKLVAEPEKVHTNFDEVPLTKTKIEALNDLTDGHHERIREYIFPFALRHNEWRTKGIKEIFKTPNVGPKGSNIKTKVEDRSSVKILDKDDDIDEDNISMHYLRLFIEECEKRDIDLLITCLPYYGHKANQRGLNSTKRIVDEYDVPFVDVRWDGLIDPTYDMADLNHVNYSGATKLTDHFSDYIKEHYDLPDHRGDGSELTDKWNKDYSDYRSYLLDKALHKGKLPKHRQQCLVLMSGGQYGALLYSKAAPNETEMKLIDNYDNIELISKDEAEDLLGHKVKSGSVMIFTEPEPKQAVSSGGGKDHRKAKVIAEKEFE